VTARVTPSRLALRRTVAPVTSSPAIARVGQPGRVDVQVLGWAIRPGHNEAFPKNDDLQGLIGENDVRIVPTLVVHPHNPIPHGLAHKRRLVRLQQCVNCKR